MPPWTEGKHTVRVAIQDMAKNDIDTAKRDFIFTIDKTPPAITEVKAKPKEGTQPPQGLPIGARGKNATISAKVADKAGPDPGTFDTKNGVVVGQLFNSTLGLQTSFVPMIKNGTVWEVNLTIPTSWPASAFGVRARVAATDLVGNLGQNTTVGDAFLIDPVAPVILDEPQPAFIKDVKRTIRANITDVGSQVNKDKVFLNFINITGVGGFKTPPSQAKVNGYHQLKMSNPQGGNFTGDIPAAKHGTVIAYFLQAEDRAAGLTVTPVRTMTVDIGGPNLTEPTHVVYRGKTPYRMDVQASDLGVGLNTSAVFFFYKVTGDTVYTNVTMSNHTGDLYYETVDPLVEDGNRVDYYFEALDKLNNKGNLNTSSKPLNFTVDLAAPSFDFVGLANSYNNATFTLRWNGTDAASGVKDFTIQARIVTNATNIPWVTIADHTMDRSLEFCAEGNGNQYEVRGFATDNVGNAGAPSTAKRFRLNGPGCQEATLVTVLAPSASTDVNAATASDLEVRFSAVSSRTFTPSSSLRIDIDFSPDNGLHWLNVTKNAPNTGNYTIDLDNLTTCNQCLIRVTATSLSGVKGSDTSPPFRIRNLDTALDLDNNGLPDGWELKYGTRLGQFVATADDDDDGLTNAEEARFGTNPKAADTDNDGFSDELETRFGTSPLNAQSFPTAVQGRTREWTPVYWTIPGMGAATLLLYVIGLARRW